MICKYFDSRGVCLSTGYECIYPIKGYQTCAHYQFEKDKAFLRGDRWSAVEFKKMMDQQYSRYVSTEAADDVRIDPPSVAEIMSQAEEAKKAWASMDWSAFNKLLTCDKEKKMDTNYEYKVAGDTISLTPERIAEYNPCEKEFGRYSLWYFTNNRGALPTEKNLAAIVEKGEIVWLDWLVEKGLVERTEVKRKLTLADCELRSSGGDVELHIDGSRVLRFDQNGGVFRCYPCIKQKLIPVDGKCRIIID